MIKYNNTKSKAERKKKRKKERKCWSVIGHKSQDLKEDKREVTTAVSMIYLQITIKIRTNYYDEKWTNEQKKKKYNNFIMVKHFECDFIL